MEAAAGAALQVRVGVMLNSVFDCQGKRLNLIMMCRDAINGKLFNGTDGCQLASNFIVQHGHSMAEGEQSV